MSTTLFLILSRADISGATAGFMLVFAGAISYNINWLLLHMRQFELNGISLERTTEFRLLPREDGSSLDSPETSIARADYDERQLDRSLGNWPSEGKLSVRDLRVRYGPDMPEILHDVSFDIEGGQRVGIVGATGGGKSTLAKAFFSFVEVTHGKIEIDDKGEFLAPTKRTAPC